MNRRILSIATAFALCLSLLPVEAFAETDDGISWPEAGGTVSIGSTEYVYKGDYTSQTLDLESSPVERNIYKAGEGYVLWDGTDGKNLITLHDAQITTSYTAFWVPGGAKITVEGSNTLTGSAQAISTTKAGGFEISGPGSLSAFTGSTGAWAYAITASSSGNISIGITGDFTSNGIQAQNGDVTVKSGGGVSIAGLVRAGSSISVEAENDLSITNSENMAIQSIGGGGVALTAKNGGITVSGGSAYNQYAIQGTSGPVTLDASGEVLVTGYGGYPGVNGGSLTLSGVIPEGTTLHSSCSVTVPAGKTLSNDGTLFVNSGSVTVEGVLKTSEGSSIENGNGPISPTASGSGTIEEAPATVSSLDFRFAAPDGEKEYVIAGGGTAKWEPGSGGAANKLTLNGVTMSGGSYVIGVPGNTEIVLTGENRITATSSNLSSPAIVAQAGDLKISGPGSLTVSADESNYALTSRAGDISITIDGPLTVSSGSVLAEKALLIQSDDDINIIGAINTMDGEVALNSTSGSVTVAEGIAASGTSGSVTVTAGTFISIDSQQAPLRSGVSAEGRQITLAAQNGDLTVQSVCPTSISGTYGTTAVELSATGNLLVMGKVISGELSLSGAIPEDTELRADASLVTVPAEKALVNNGSLEFSARGGETGPMTVAGTLYHYGTIRNGSGTIMDPITTGSGQIIKPPASELDFSSRTENAIGAGYAWDNAARTLTLTDYRSGGSDPSIILPDGSKLILSGTNTLQCRLTPIIQTLGALEISGGGTLSGTSGGGIALDAHGNVTIKDSRVTLVSTQEDTSGVDVLATHGGDLRVEGSADLTVMVAAGTEHGFGINTREPLRVTSPALRTASGGIYIGEDAAVTAYANIGVLIEPPYNADMAEMTVAGALRLEGGNSTAGTIANLLGVNLNLDGGSISMPEGCKIDLSQKENTLLAENIREFNGILRVATGQGVYVRYYKVSRPDGIGLYQPGTEITVSAGISDFEGWEADGITLDNPLLNEITFAMPENDVALTYRKAVTGVTLNQTQLTLTVGSGTTLTAAVAPSDATNKNVTWTSSNDLVARVDASGNVTAVGEGQATITVTTADGGKSAACTIRVEKIPVVKDTPTLIVSPITVTYTGEAIPDSAIQGTAKVGDITVSGAWAFASGEAVTNVADSGTKNVVFTPSDTDNYSEARGIVAVRINPASVAGAAITLSDTAYRYNGEVQVPDVTVRLGDDTLTAGTDYTVSYSSDCIKAGTIAITVTGQKNYGGAVSSQYEIRPATLTPFLTGAVSKAYDGTAAAPAGLSVNLSGILKSDNVTAVAGSSTYASANAGTWAITASCITLGGTAAGNYTLSATAAAIEGTITQADAPAAKGGAMAVSNDLERTYSYTLDQLLPALTGGQTFGSVTYALGAVALGDYYDTGAAVAGNKLSLPIKAVAADEEQVIGTVQITISSTNFKDMTATITVSSVNRITPEGTPAASPSTITYGQPVSAVTLSGEMHDGSGRVDGKFTWDHPNVTPDAGTYQAAWTFTPTDTGRYTTAAGAVAITVLKATPDLTLTPSPAALPSGGTVTLTLSGLPDGGAATMACDDESISVAPGSGSTWTATLPNSAATYTFTASYAGSGNYNAASASCTVTTKRSSSDPSWDNSDSGGGVSTYAVTIVKPEHGKVTSSRTSASSNSIVILTVTPDSGYMLNTLTVTDSRGNEIKLTAQGGGRYAFTMPSSAVTVTAAFAPLPEQVEQPCDGGADCPSHGFTDLGAAGTWYHEAVDYVLRNGLMNGYGNGTFGPDDYLSRAMLAQILYNSAGKPAVTGSSVFTDAAPGQWHTNAVIWANRNGIVGGYGNGLFGPNDNITREQLAVMLWRYAGSPAVTDKELNFTDAGEAGGYALAAVRWAVENGVINGYGDGRLGPKGLATRAQAAQMLTNFLKDQ